MPLGETSRPLGGRDAASGVSSRIRKVFFHEEAPPRGPVRFFSTPRPLDGRDVASRAIIGREAPIFRILPNRHPFFEFKFF
jgi:hypothetical protein